MMPGTSTLFFAVLTVAALLQPVAAAKVRIATDVTAPRRGEPGLPPNGACASTDDPEQCLALMDLYGATNGELWANNAGWLSGSSYCGWYGVTCEGSGNVPTIL